jgi:hypothetical protein
MWLSPLPAPGSVRSRPSALCIGHPAARRSVRRLNSPGASFFGKTNATKRAEARSMRFSGAAFIVGLLTFGGEASAQGYCPFLPFCDTQQSHCLHNCGALTDVIVWRTGRLFRNNVWPIATCSSAAASCGARAAACVGGASSGLPRTHRCLFVSGHAARLACMRSASITTV